MRQIKDQFRNCSRIKQKGEEEQDSDSSLALKKQPSGVRSIMRVFKTLEHSTDQLWLDFSKQYSTIGSSIFGGKKQALQDLKDKYLDDDQAEELEEEERLEAERQRAKA